MIAVFVFAGNIVLADQKPKTVAEVALYKGADRQQILEEGARKEGKLTFYTTHILNPLHINAFRKKYPYIKVEVWRASGIKLLPRITEEYKVGRHICDLVEATQTGMMVLQKGGIVRPFYSPNLAYIEEGAIKKAQGGGVLAAGTRLSGIGMGYNTKLITKEEVPKTHQDLLDPKWKGKMAIGAQWSGVSWMGSMLVTYGEDFVRRMAKQNFDVHMVSGRGILDMVIAGEYMFSPSMFDSHVWKSKEKGAPVDWLPIAPVPALLSQVALPKHPSSPHATLLLIDFYLSKEDAKISKATGYSPSRKDASGEKTYKKFYGAKSVKEKIKWDNLFNRLFLKR
ncbi:ABC transporter substrate-binding protein [Thermodesulfobacteriota bacterium]